VNRRGGFVEGCKPGAAVGVEDSRQGRHGEVGRQERNVCGRAAAARSRRVAENPRIFAPQCFLEAERPL
jgi:hypothetical protein